ncbi:MULTISPECIES: DEAD/DEAH box helicase [unclassified Leptolyngbya]|uniref:DEAD/DEAH box helicase n=1 Tax=unclassified Leptolyngbya TaxID=2650499 RepID=UPI001689619A|nr:MULTISPECIES: DEAD/DEAH box helicase [unclassified Leptolyngbya]MBD1912395.1 DEAD/DEAH box helicase [Leptolyngbya sp. FACHB-8]MBD2154799.1 DEAD/DEAH box helicase [Leptolyngbya sp. FACHB-16]
MPQSYAEIEAIREQLVKQYRALSPLDQCIVQLFSIAYEPMRRSVFTTCFQNTGIRDSKGKPVNKNLLLERLNQLLAAELLIDDKDQDPRCHPLLIEVATRDALKAKRFDALANAVQDNLPIHAYGKNGPYYFNSPDQLIRQVRISFYSQNLKVAERYYESYLKYGIYGNPRRTMLTLEEIIRRICSNPFDPAWINTLPADLFKTVMTSLLSQAALQLQPLEEALQLLQAEWEKPDGRSSSDLRLQAVDLLVLRGDLAGARQVLGSARGLPGEQEAIAYATLHFFEGEQEKAIARFEEAARRIKKAGTSRTVVYGDPQEFSGLGDLVYILTHLKENTPPSLELAANHANLITKYPKHWLKNACISLYHVIQLQRGNLSHRDSLQSQEIEPYNQGHSLETLVQCLCLYWVDSEGSKRVLTRLLEPLYKQAAESGYTWMAWEAAQMLARLKPKSTFKVQAEILKPERYGPTLVEAVPFRELWELSLQALVNLRYQPVVAAKPPAPMRLAWFLTYDSSENYLIQPREQKVNAKGVWSRGRPIALKRLRENRDMDYLTPQDHQVCAHLEVDYSYNYQGQYQFGERAIVALVGHPHVYLEEAPEIRVEIVKGEPELIVKRDEKGERLTLQFSPPIYDHAADVALVKETPTRFKVVDITADHRQIATIIGSRNHLDVPAAAEEGVLSAINAVSNIVTVHSDVGGGVSDVESVPAVSIPHIHLLPIGEGLKMALMTRPFGESGPYFRPGSGGATVIGEIDGKRLQTTRDLAEERERAAEVIAICATLERFEEENGEWILPAPEDCLELLTELHQVGDRAILEWPEGERLRVTQTVGFGSFKLKIQQQRDWFEASGELQLPDGQVMDMKRLMELMATTPGRFIPLADGQFLALTEAFRKRLDEFSRFSDMQGDKARFHPLAAIALTDFMEEVGDLKTDKHWKNHLQKLRDMQEFHPQLPSTLQAELRDYQVDGFTWLAKLAHWGVGACLADDMGLGKTLQALALILTRAPQGPTLIVAPTSVCMNWMGEAQRFAPTLNPIQLGGGDRQKVLSDLQPFDMLVCSYGLLQQDDVAEMLAKTQWQTIVLDEAQAIKNVNTKRSQAAMSLQGGFKIITTGTPIENHLGELWNLFRFINPGLLGSLERFNERFATPIERYQDKAARLQLKKLIQPFILRRTKNQVLQELPSRTEILLHVEMSADEMAFYEALRREAVEKLRESTAEAGAKHLQVLAEIMKLRRACCNPRLVIPNAPVNSSKLELFGEVLSELLSNNHKALVFSQFVDHLHIIRDYLHEHQISYQYLDGSTPAKERKKRVDAFQAGEGDVFLISLKAGGTGLNLTAADYVIHMDPWWNPAVEDQASDRAHRIGQQRPVTIYRLVAKGTIEDKIVDLHRQKRDLADSLLEGADISGKMSTNELLNLISEG